MNGHHYEIRFDRFLDAWAVVRVVPSTSHTTQLIAYGSKEDAEYIRDELNSKVSREAKA